MWVVKPLYFSFDVIISLEAALILLRLQDLIFQIAKATIGFNKDVLNPISIVRLTQDK